MDATTMPPGSAMKIAILSRNSACYSTRRLIEAAQQRGHKVQCLDTMRFSIHIAEGRPSLSYRSKPLKSFDAVIPRIGASITFFGTAVVRQFEQMGVYTVNSAQAITTSRDKLRSFQVLSRHHLGLPETAFVRSKNEIMPTIARLGGAPVIIKLLEGTQGIGVILADNEAIAAAIVETLYSKQINVLLQRFVTESKGKDLRAFVVGNKVIAAMRRQAKGQEFRSNVHRGGEAIAVDLPQEYQETAVKAAQIMGLTVAGVDMLEGHDGPKIMEVNSSPGLEGIEGATGIDIAGAIIEHTAEQLHFPEIDLRQRLTLKEGYGVAELTVTAESELAGQTIQGSQLRNKDVLILHLERPGTSIPNPKGTRELLLGDKLLCFGRYSAMRGLLPQRAPDEDDEDMEDETPASA